MTDAPHPIDIPNPIDAHVGFRIRQRRTQLGLSQSQLAQLIGLRYQKIQKYELGINRVSASKLWQIAGQLKCTPPYFFEDCEGRLIHSTSKKDLTKIKHDIITLKKDLKQLNKAFEGIADREIRRIIIDLAKKLSVQERDSKAT